MIGYILQREVYLMELQARIAAVLKEQNLKQKNLASLIGVSESYVSGLVTGRNKNISFSTAMLLEEKLGYSAQWILTGQEPKYIEDHLTLSESQKRLIDQVKKLSKEEVRAVLAFIRVLRELADKPSLDESEQFDVEG